MEIKPNSMHISGNTTNYTTYNTNKPQWRNKIHKTMIINHKTMDISQNTMKKMLQKHNESKPQYNGNEPQHNRISKANQTWKLKPKHTKMEKATNHKTTELLNNTMCYLCHNTKEWIKQRKCAPTQLCYKQNKKYNTR